MKKRILVLMVCFCGLLLFSSNALTDDLDLECCCEMTCNYVRALGGSPTTIEVDKCWDIEDIPSCDEQTACLKVKNVYLTYTDTWSGQGCRVQEKCILDILYGPDHPKLDILRGFRDKILSQTPEGRQLTEIYYTWGPILVEAMEQDENFKEQVQELIELYLPMMKEENN